MSPDGEKAFLEGVARESAGDKERAAELYRLAVRYDPHAIEPRVNLGMLLRERGLLDDALHHHLLAYGLAPDHELALYNAAATLNASGRSDGAAAVVARLRREHPNSPALNQSLPASGTNVDFVQGAVAAANELSRHQAMPAAGDAAGLSVQALTPVQEACAWQVVISTLDELPHRTDLEAYRAILTHNPEIARAWLGLGRAYRKLRQLDHAWDAFMMAADRDGQLAEAWSELESVSRELGRTSAALEALRTLVALLPDNVDAMNNLGALLLEKGDFQEALSPLERAAALAPENPRVWRNLGYTRMRLGQTKLALEAFIQAIRFLPDDIELVCVAIHVAYAHVAWDELEFLQGKIMERKAAGKLLGAGPFVLISLPGITAQDQLECAQHFAKLHFGQLSERALKPGVTGRGNKDRVRIGYVSSEFRDHATAFLLAEVIEQHDRARFEILAFSSVGADSSPSRTRFEKACDRFMDISNISDDQAAELVRSLEVDVLVDLNTYTGIMRAGLFALRPAPVQIGYLGFPGTSGASFMDYLIADHIVIPPELERYYSERVLRMPRCYQPNDRKRPLPPPATKRSLDLPEDAFVFCSFNNIYKLTPDVFDLWCQLLQEVRGSVLWMLSTSADVNQHLKMQAERRGIDASRLVFAPRARLLDHLARFRCADLLLDTFPCTAHTTASDALWCGVPVVTRIGETFASRVAASVLHAIDLPQLVTRDPESYYALALRLATHPAEVAEIKSHIARVRLTCPLFDSASYTRELELLYLKALDGNEAARIHRHVHDPQSAREMATLPR